MDEKYKKYLPRSGADLPRFAGIPTFMPVSYTHLTLPTIYSV